MNLSSVSENREIEKRIAITPEIAKKYISLGFNLTLPNNYGTHLGFNDEDYKNLGVNFLDNEEEIIKNSEIIIQLGLPVDEKLSLFKENQTLIGSLNAFLNKEKLENLKSKKINCFSLELLPRITRAQSMDILSSQANLAGYKAVVEAFQVYEKAIPMMMTAAGTIPAAKVLVVGAGVAGLQAIATAKRLGAVVSAFDVRAAAKEQVESLGAKFIEVVTEDEDNSDNETASGYAKEMSEDYKKKQQNLLHETIKTQDIVITTALIPGKDAPELITNSMVKDMKGGSIIVDLAAEAGGNCKLTKLNEIIIEHDVKIIGYSDFPSKLSQDASNLYAKNLLNFVQLMVKDKKIEIDWEDEIIKSVVLTHDGNIQLEDFK